ncbi:cysteine dioxygenase family protein [Mesobacillus subterraneus]|uniref:cysteine dioxygenase n=1 Tax=Mesobacillus subterraneus TaxID=285983 RepID=UPI00273F10D4|nr:cysteine dioxygenase family protein [Mesobacillus subterraneus]WLR54760.1 cysteine dioxygenase family protein [Mesobacillus subterraneus]
MTLNSQAKKLLDLLKNPSKQEMKKALANINMSEEELKPFLQSSSGKPYYRKLLYKTEDVELLVMNWSDLECAPHDHGDSHGWIQVLNGTSINSVYEVIDNSLPKELFKEYHHQGKFFYAPQKGVHKMQADAAKGLVTLHLYSPPISGMKVYDLEKCAVCVVSDDCGAW